MAIQLYRAGNTHTVRGIECELCNFDACEMDYQLNAGWCKSPEDIGHEQPEEESEEESEEETALNPVRIAAKAAGIEGWDIKRIKTLEGLLDELKD